MSDRRVPRPELDAIAGRLGTRLVTAEPASWGDAGATYRVGLADGRSMAARRVGGDHAATRADAIRDRMTRLAAEGLPVPMARTIDLDGGSWLLTPWVDGAPGSTWLDDPDRARRLARRMGDLALRIRHLDPPIVHGDLAPINVVVEPEGEIVALLDFEHAGPGPALLDVAWWGWVVRHHHPAAWEAAWPTFLAAAGLERGPIERELHALALQALDARAATAGDPETRRRWLDRRSAAERWSVAG